MTDEPKVGAVLELGQAAERITAALTAHADNPTPATMEAVQAAFSAYVTALGSNTTSMMAGGLGLVFKKLDKLTISVNDHTEAIDHRFRAYNAELNEYRQQNQALLALVEERLLAPFGEMATRVETLEYGYADLADRVDAALDPETPGATIAMVVIQDRVRLLTWLVWALIAVVLVEGLFLIGHHYYLWERLR